MSESNELTNCFLSEVKGGNPVRVFYAYPERMAHRVLGPVFIGSAAAFSRTGSQIPKDFHLNHESILPPVDCELLIAVPVWEDKPLLLRAIRPGFVESKGDILTYELQQLPVMVGEPQNIVFIGNTIKGRFKWTYP